MQGQMVLCRGCVLLAKRRLPAEQRTLLLAKAAKAVEMALRAYGCTARSRSQLVKRTARLVRQFRVRPLCAPERPRAPCASAWSNLMQGPVPLLRTAESHTRSTT
eukprot:scaffold114267_cov66-Phaeocystis_antarctica.AAC.2